MHLWSKWATSSMPLAAAEPNSKMLLKYGSLCNCTHILIVCVSNGNFFYSFSRFIFLTLKCNRIRISFFLSWHSHSICIPWSYSTQRWPKSKIQIRPPWDQIICVANDILLPTYLLFFVCIIAETWNWYGFDTFPTSSALLQFLFDQVENDKEKNKINREKKSRKFQW